MRTKVIDFTKITKKYKGRWVALTEDEKKVVSFGESPANVLDEALKKGYKNPVLFKVPAAILPFVGANTPLK